jgi:excisionase family DNA binding protein
MSALNTNTQTLSETPTLQVIDNHITVQEASEITGYNAQYLRRLLRAGKMEAIKIGQIWLVNLTSLQAYISCAISSNDLRCGPKGTASHGKTGSPETKVYCLTRRTCAR